MSERWSGTETGRPAEARGGIAGWVEQRRSLLTSLMPWSLGARGSLVWPAVALETFLLGLVAVAPVGGVSQTISPLARAWPWLLAPARAVFGDRLVEASVPAERGWPALALFAVLLVGASCASALAVARARAVHMSGRR